MRVGSKGFGSTVSLNSARIPLVACPFFLPVTRLDQNGWIHAPRLPLGDPYRGVCQSRPDEPFEPPESAHDLCNCGYARGRCDRFPAGTESDAVRFSITSVEADLVRLTYVLEREHAPVDYGTLKYAIRESRLVDAPARPILEKQAKAFLESHFDRRARAAGVAD
jgi:hypothetical protein